MRSSHARNLRVIGVIAFFFLLYTQTVSAQVAPKKPTTGPDPAAAAAKPKAAAKKAKATGATKTAPKASTSNDAVSVGFFMFPNIIASAKRQLKIYPGLTPQELAETMKNLQKLMKQAKPGTQQQLMFILPMAQKLLPLLSKKNLPKLIKKLPKMAKQFGFDIQSPVGGFVSAYKGAFIPVLSAKVFPNLLLQAAHRFKVQASFFPQIGQVRFLSVTLKKKSQVLGVLLGHRLYLALPFIGKAEKLLNNIKNQQEFLRHLVLKNDPLQDAINKAHIPNLKAKLKRKELDMVVGSLSLQPFAKLAGAKPFAIVKKFFKGLSLSAAMDVNSYFKLRFDFTKHVTPFLTPLRPSGKLADISGHIPASFAWIGRSFMNIPSLLNLPKTFHQMGFLPLNQYQQFMMGYSMAKMTIMAQFGVNLDQLLGSLDGQLFSGLLLTGDMKQRFKNWSTGRAFRGHMRGVFLAIGFKKATGPSTFLSTLSNLHKTLKQRFPRRAGIVKLTQGKAQGTPYMQIAVPIPNTSAVYAIPYKKFLFIAGDSATRDLLLKVWKNPKLSLANSTAPQSKAAVRDLKSNANTLTFNTAAILNAVKKVLPMTPFMVMIPKAQYTNIIKQFEKIDGFSLRTRADATSWTEMFLSKSQLANSKVKLKAIPPIQTKNMTALPKGQAPNLLGAAMGTSLAGGVLSFPLSIWAAIAIPAFLKYIRKAKTSEATMNIHTIARAAQSYAGTQYNDKNGNPLPKQFPCANQGWICAPAKKPCANGQPQYSPNPAAWNHKCWRTLRFAINRKHYFRYCYKAETKGPRKTYEVRAQADLDCDGKLSTYKVRGYFDHNGFPSRTNLIVTDGLE